MAKQYFITDNEQTYIALDECHIVEIEVGEDDDFDEVEERLNDGEGIPYFIVKGEIDYEQMSEDTLLGLHGEEG